MKKMSTKVLFYGSVWGFAEATLGYMLHIFTVPFTGFFMFPLGFYFMRRAAIETDQNRAPFYVALVAAAIKLVDLFLPNVMLIKVFNPALAIVLQGIGVSVFLSIRHKDTIQRALAASFSWRLAFIGFVYMEGLMGYQVRLLNSGTAEIVRYLTLDAIVNAVIIYAIVKLLQFKKIEVKPSFAFVALLAAVSINILA